MRVSPCRHTRLCALVKNVAGVCGATEASNRDPRSRRCISYTSQDDVVMPASCAPCCRGGERSPGVCPPLSARGVTSRCGKRRFGRRAVPSAVAARVLTDDTVRRTGAHAGFWHPALCTDVELAPALQRRVLLYIALTPGAGCCVLCDARAGSGAGCDRCAAVPEPARVPEQGPVGEPRRGRAEGQGRRHR